MKKTYYIYKITNLINNKIYIGKRGTIKPINEDKYFGSGKILKIAIKKYGKTSFKKEIIEICENEEILNAREIFWISEINSFYPNGYNINIGGKGGDTFTYRPNKDEFIERLREFNRGRKLSDEVRKNMSKAHLGIPQPPCKKEICKYCGKLNDVRNLKRWHNENCVMNPERKFSDNSKKLLNNTCPFCGKRCYSKHGKQFHFEYCEYNPNKIINNNLIKRNSDESNRKRSKKLKGRIITDVMREKISQSNKKRWETNENIYICSHCGKQTRVKTNFIRWHNENCKHKK